MSQDVRSFLPTRRAVVGGLLASAPLLGAAPAWAKGPQSVDVVIIGAGLAGLNAASILEGQGLSVQVVEASDRVGGRLRTGRKDGYQAELGASEVGALYGRVRDACSRLNVGLTNKGGIPTDFLLHVNGVSLRPQDWANAPVNMTRGAERSILPYILQTGLFQRWLPFKDTAAWLDPANLVHDISAAEFMRAKGVSEAAIRLADIDVNGPSLESISALSIFRDLARARAEGFTDPNKPQYGVNNMERSYIVGGSDVLPKAMAAALKTPVRLLSPAVAVDQDGGKVRVQLANGDVLTGKYLVVAAPYSAVRNIRFTPGLPDAQADAIAGALYSATTQFHFRITKPYWEQDGLPPSLWTDLPFERAFALKSPETGATDTLIVWVNGDGATRWDDREVEQQSDLVIAELARVRPSMVGALDYILGYSWGRNPYVRGNKHVFGPGQVKRFAADMGKPVGRIHFAGEHLRRLEHGMESAMETGEAAAMEILEKA
ncbi:NAD(P)/FAD-dependent oxidoreductase [Nitrospirillum sp. BR 11828]|uniref:flavin monoamine oxidase family protein n=1 Tax=Nitrospirillum sp. BR 11828 TaxID=3104325 RepID=UPI002ACAF1F1|nr:NAD(P)/FAD-dependent oxidoreductase [Nitrospirillum sp. BR 11828]MDZ5649447.1 NAD(P)/FAD-dependent oxidoreductase [Nitrospirillum sp. BR 11828]